MFKQFTRTEKPVDPKIVAIGARAPRQEAAPAAPTAEESELMARLELKSKLHDVLLDRLNLAVIDRVQPDELRREVAALVSQALTEEGRPMRTEEFKQLVDELLDEVLGFGPLEPLLADPTINDILVNTHRSVYVERAGVLEKSPVRFRDERHLLRIIDKIVSRIGRRVDESNPWVDARLADGSRVNAIIRPCAIDGPSMSIRKFARRPLTMERMIEIGTLNEAAALLLQGLVKAKLNILISGGTGSGKTTMLNAMSRNIGARERIVTIEDAAELQLQQDHVVRLETRPASPSGGGSVTQRDLVRNALRMRPDRIIVGEVRGAETFDMLQAMNTGHEGSMTTVHANTARDALGRIEQMVTMIGLDFPVSAIRSQIASGLNVVIQLNRLSDGTRRVMSISEITGIEGSTITMQDIFVYRKTGTTESGQVLGEFMATGIRPRCADAIRAAGVDLRGDLFASRGTSQ
ncbi:CpaF family protein [Defluviimonas sp. WL0024]|uniref:CpaF family protein n=2 Tax=Albidovulum TaxID=205889 RepID=A0ABT3J432_9RHOB|nr:CpaF family protein [Defluviimonas sp. WL0024]MCU9847843.1 CpaF family protein [Defluviimonas sp. WL0024]MCW3782444.1 CpaF family protein [Defluviimonas salinarum]